MGGAWFLKHRIRLRTVNSLAYSPAEVHYVKQPESVEVFWFAFYCSCGKENLSIDFARPVSSSTSITTPQIRT